MDPVAAGFAEEARSARCDYCGGHPCCGGTGFLFLGTGAAPKTKWMCMSCGPEYYDFVQSAVSTIAEEMTGDEQIKRLKEIESNTDAHMAAFVSCRDN